MPTSRTREGDRFYYPPAVRHRLQQQQQQRVNVSKVLSVEECVSPKTTNLKGSEDKCETEKVGDGDVDAKLTNLDRFLECTTPKVQAHCFNKKGARGSRAQQAAFHPYFVLEDLWESFKEWSVYGAGVPLLLAESESVVQYYVPYLSGIQLYIDPSRPSTRRRGPGVESEMGSSRGTSSDGSSDYGAERDAGYIMGDWSQQNVENENIQRMSRLSVGNIPSISSSSDESETCSLPKELLFEYFEHCPPFNREPLADKITVLASDFPELRTYKSCDLSPSSWISVAWYPIYRIPTGTTLQSLDTCFLTFHSLSTTSPGTSSDGPHVIASCARGSHNVDSFKLSLPIFGLSLYKFKVSFWSSKADQECQKATSLLSTADRWLRELNVYHPDHSFFVSHSSYRK